MVYVPNPTDATQPTDGNLAESATAEFRALKAYIQQNFALAGTQNSVGKNLIIGGDISVNPFQRGITFTVVGAAKNYTMDRFWHTRGAGAAFQAVQQPTVPADPGFPLTLILQHIAADASASPYTFATDLKSIDSKRLAGRTVTLTIRGIKSGTFTPTAMTLSLLSGTGTDQTLFTGYTGQTLLAQIDLTQLPAVQSNLSVTVAVPATVTQLGVQIGIVPTAAAAGVNDYIGIQHIQLEDSTVFTGFERKSAAQTLFDCQEFFWKTFAPATVPAQNVGASTGELVAITAVAGAVTQAIPGVHPRVMRAPPTGIIFNPSAANAQIRDESNNLDSTGSAVGRATERMFLITAAGNAGTAANAILGVHATFSAEL